MQIFDPSEFFRLGQRLIRAWDDDATYRTTIGRAYYSCFLHARDAMFGSDGIGLTSKLKKQILRAANKKSGGDHEAVVLALSQHKKVRPGKAKVLSDQLGQLKALRVQADYKLDSLSPELVRLFSDYSVKDWKGLAHTSLTLASQLLPSLKSEVHRWQ